jgi:hypothetical protein
MYDLYYFLTKNNRDNGSPCLRPHVTLNSNDGEPLINTKKQDIEMHL